MNGKALCLLWVAVVLHVGLAAAEEQTLQSGNFGTVTVYGRSPQPSHVVLFVSGDGGSNLGVVDMARELAALDALVAGSTLRITSPKSGLPASRVRIQRPISRP